MPGDGGKTVSSVILASQMQEHLVKRDPHHRADWKRSVEVMQIQRRQGKG
jgi:hypothetical protein